MCVFLLFLLLNKLRNTFCFRGPAPSQKATFQREILELGSYTNLAQHEMCPIFFLKTHSTLLYYVLYIGPIWPGPFVHTYIERPTHSFQSRDPPPGLIYEALVRPWHPSHYFFRNRLVNRRVAWVYYFKGQNVGKVRIRTCFCANYEQTLLLKNLMKKCNTYITMNRTQKKITDESDSNMKNLTEIW